MPGVRVTHGPDVGGFTLVDKPTISALDEGLVPVVNVISPSWSLPAMAIVGLVPAPKPPVGPLAAELEPYINDVILPATVLFPAKLCVPVVTMPGFVPSAGPKVIVLPDMLAPFAMDEPENVPTVVIPDVTIGSLKSLPARFSINILSVLRAVDLLGRFVMDISKPAVLMVALWFKVPSRITLSGVGDRRPLAKWMVAKPYLIFTSFVAGSMVSTLSLVPALDIEEILRPDVVSFEPFHVKLEEPLKAPELLN